MIQKKIIRTLLKWRWKSNKGRWINWCYKQFDWDWTW